jgi:hypothetical protein
MQAELMRLKGEMEVIQKSASSNSREVEEAVGV